MHERYLYPAAAFALAGGFVEQGGEAVGMPGGTTGRTAAATGKETLWLGSVLAANVLLSSAAERLRDGWRLPPAAVSGAGALMALLGAATVWRWAVMRRGFDL